jgi:hypothetical protein
MFLISRRLKDTNLQCKEQEKSKGNVVRGGLYFLGGGGIADLRQI